MEQVRCRWVENAIIYSNQKVVFGFFYVVLFRKGSTYKTCLSTYTYLFYKKPVYKKLGFIQVKTVG